MKPLTIVILVVLTLPALAQPVSDVALPRPRPDSETVVAPATPPDRETEPGNSGTSAAVLPRLYQAACPAILGGTVTATRQDPIAENICRVRSPYAVTALAVGGREVALSQPATLTCGMATALAGWAARIDAYARAVHNAGLAAIRNGTSYACRPRNNQPGGVMSEHGFANALDVVGFAFTDGTVITLPMDWANDNAAGRTMRYAQDAACGYFTTVLGPNANASHADHLHLDLGCHGATCTARICD